MQSNATAKRFLWIELAIYWYVIRNELYSFKIVLEFYFLRNREKSVANSWEREIGREIVRLTTKSWDLANVRLWTSVSLDLGVNFYTWAFSTLTPITTRVDIKAIRWQPNAQNNVHTTLYQNTHQACYRVGWPGGGGVDALSPNPSLLSIYLRLSGLQSPLLLIYFLMVHTNIISHAAVFVWRQKRLCMTLRIGVAKNRSGVWRSTFTMGRVVQYPNKFMHGIVLYCLHITILY